MGRRLGQHFLINNLVIEKTIATVADSLAPIIEVGPGKMALTQGLLQLDKPLLLIEKDPDLIESLQQAIIGRKDTQLYFIDVLDFDFKTAFDHFKTPFCILSNLPYLISTPFLQKMVEVAPFVTKIHLLLQKEVVEKVLADKGPLSSKLSHLLGIYYDKVAGDVVPASDFDPPPRVESQFLSLIPKKTPLLGSEEFSLFSDLIHFAYNHRRHTLHWVFKKTNFAPFKGITSTIEEFSTQQLIDLYRSNTAQS